MTEGRASCAALGGGGAFGLEVCAGVVAAVVTGVVSGAVVPHGAGLRRAGGRGAGV